jgi:hypothetical protein
MMTMSSSTIVKPALARIESLWSGQEHAQAPKELNDILRLRAPSALR